MQARGLWQRATGTHHPAEALSWDSVQEWASSEGQVLPAPTKAQLVSSKATNTPIAQIQVSPPTPSPQKNWAATRFVQLLSLLMAISLELLAFDSCNLGLPHEILIHMSRHGLQAFTRT